MKRWIKLLVTLVLATSIPLQGLAAATMPMCSMSPTSMDANMVMGSSAMDGAMPMNQPCDKKCQECCVPQNSNPSKKTTGQKCFVCHLSAIQMPVVLALAASPEIATKFPPLINEHYQAFPPGLYRPPKSLSA